MSRKAIGITLALAAASVVPVSAIASSYAVSINEITNFGLTFSGTGSVVFNGFTFSNSAAASESGGTGNASLFNAPASCIGDCTTFAADNYNANGTGYASYAYGDAIIGSTNVIGMSGAASSMGEAYVDNGLRYGSGSNSMVASFTVSGGSTQASISFDADLFMQTLLSAGGISSSAYSVFQITLANVNAPGTLLFSWNPNGSLANGITGGTENWDPFNLNAGLAANQAYSGTTSLGSQFSAITNMLAAGTYTMNISMSQTVNVSAVPVPAAAWLLGSGLIGLVGVARRKSH